MSKRIKSLTFIIAVVFLTGCVNNGEQMIELKIQAETAMVSAELEESEVEKQLEKDPLRLAVASILSIRETEQRYESLIKYLEKSLGRPVELIQRQTYHDIKELFEQGELDVGVVCAYLAVIGDYKGDMEKLVMPVNNGEESFTSYIIVNDSVEANRLEDLQGLSFAFSDPLSYSGYLFTKHELWKMDSNPTDFFESSYYTYSHDNTISSVSNGLVDAGATHSQVYDQLVMEGSTLIEGTRVIGEGPYSGNSPVVVHPDLKSDIKDKIKEVLLSMHKTEAGTRVLEQLRIDYFQDPRDELFFSVQLMLQDLEWVYD